MSEGPVTAGVTTPGAPPDAAEQGADPALIGRTINGTYKIEKFLGGGAMGAVYRARQIALERNVAVKVMHRAVAVDPSFAARFHREAKAASRLDHPNSMRVLDFGEEPDGLLYIAMELLDGRDLYRVIHEDWPLSNERISDILMQALAAIAVAHDMGVIHRDLKPENIMILRTRNDDGKDADLVKVCDFGIAKITEKDDDPKPAGDPAARKLTTQGLVVGTPEYMSPEQARGEKLDARSDLYSMGVILYQLLTGRTPFTGDTALAVVLKHITDTPTPLEQIYPGVHRGLADVALKAMAKEQSARFQSARDMRNALRAALDGRPMPVDVASATEAALPNAAVGTAGTVPIVVNATNQTAPVAALGSAPTIAGTASAASTLTPLGSAAVAEPAKKSKTGLAIGIIAGLAVLGVAAAFGAPKLLKQAPTEPVSTASTASPTTSTAHAPTAPTASHAPTSTASIVAEPKSSAPEPKTAKTTTASTSHTTTVNAHATTATNTQPAPEPPPAVATPPTPPPATVEPTPPPTAAPPPPTAAPPPAFNSATCHATPGAARPANGAINAKDISASGAAGAFGPCAKLLKEKPAGPVAATVKVNFSDTGQFRGASCVGCPPAIQQCVTGAARNAVRINIRSGDVTGDPAVDIPLTVSCD